MHGRRTQSGPSARAAIVAVATLMGCLLSGVPTSPATAVGPTSSPPTSCATTFLREAAPAQTACEETQPTTAAGNASLPAGFAESVVWSGLTSPTNIEFAADGRVFVAEKSGVIKVFGSLSDPTPTVFSGLTTNVQDFWDRGLLGLALDPSLTDPTLPLRPWVYVLYTYDHVLGSAAAAPRWGDACPDPPGATTDGCVVSGRLSRFTVDGTTISGPEQVLIEDWCQQYPSHSIGSLGFGPEGALYVSAGDGASFAGVDYGQRGGTVGTPPPTPMNPCSDPPGGAMSLPTAEGGALRSQDLRTESASGSGRSYAQTVLADAPVAYWRLGEASGTTVADSAGTNVGTYVGAPTLSVSGALTGDSNTAVAIDGVNDAITVPDTAALHLGDGPWSMEFWYNRANLSTNGYILSKGSGTAWPYLDYDGQIYVTVAGSGDAVSAAGPDDSGIWHHLVITKTAADAWKVYVDGVDRTVPIASLSTTSNATGVTIANSAWKGALDEVALYPTALSASQVQAHYAAATAGSDPTTLDGTILRVDPVTGASFAGNPYASSQDLNKRRIIAYGLRNPFRFALRPGTNELWLGDVGTDASEEIDRIANTADATVENFGWPCYEGTARMPAYEELGLSICNDLYATPSALTLPYYAYPHGVPVDPAETTCTDGGSSISGIAFYPETGGDFPAQYRGGLFFADHTRNCMWWMAEGANGQPDPSTRAVFLDPATNPVDIAFGPGGALYYVDFDGGTIREIKFASGNQPPKAVAQASPTGGPAPLTVNFDGTGSSDPDPNDTLTYEWDLDGDGAFGDSTSATPSWVYQSQASVTVSLRVTDPGGLSDIDTVTISPGNTPPTPTINTPVEGTTWEVGQQISFTGSASDQQDGPIPAASLSWQLTIMHCPITCHSHDVQAWSGVASGSFFAPDHEYPSSLELTLTATDTGGLTSSTTLRLDPKTVALSFLSIPTGLQLMVNGVPSTTPFDETVIKGSTNSITAVAPQTLGGQTYMLQQWSDGGAASHDIIASADMSFTATYAAASSYAQTVLADAPVAYWRLGEASGTTVADSAGTNVGTYVGAPTLSVSGALTGDSNTAVAIDGVNDAITVPDTAALHLGDGPWSMEFWYNRANLSTNGYILSKGSGTAWPYLDYDGQIYVTVAGSGDAVSAAGPDDSGIWHHLVITKTAADAWKVYVDGVDRTVPIASLSTTSNATGVTIANSAWKGALDEVALYPTALSASQVQAHYAAATGP